MILNKHDLEDDWNEPEQDEAPCAHCDWCGEAIHEDERFCPATDCQAKYFECSREEGDPPEDAAINELYRTRGWAA